MMTAWFKSYSRLVIAQSKTILVKYSQIQNETQRNVQNIVRKRYAMMNNLYKCENEETQYKYKKIRMMTQKA